MALPVNLNGSYWVAACADSYNVVTETVENNNCASVPVTVAAADLKEIEMH